jgi:hypothetical protein
VKQVAPWTCYVHMVTGKRFYYNEEDNYGQFETPLCMLDDSIPVCKLLKSE